MSFFIGLNLELFFMKFSNRKGKGMVWRIRPTFIFPLLFLTSRRFHNQNLRFKRDITQIIFYLFSNELRGVSGEARIQISHLAS